MNSSKAFFLAVWAVFAVPLLVKMFSTLRDLLLIVSFGGHGHGPSNPNMVLAIAGFATVSALSALSAVPAALATFALLLGERLFGRTISIRAAIIFAFVLALAIWSSGFFFFSSGLKGNSEALGFCLSLIPLFFISFIAPLFVRDAGRKANVV